MPRNFDAQDTHLLNPAWTCRNQRFACRNFHHVSIRSTNAASDPSAKEARTVQIQIGTIIKLAKSVPAVDTFESGASSSNPKVIDFHSPEICQLAVSKTKRHAAARTPHLTNFLNI